MTSPPTQINAAILLQKNHKHQQEFVCTQIHRTPKPTTIRMRKKAAVSFSRRCKKEPLVLQCSLD